MSNTLHRAPRWQHRARVLEALALLSLAWLAVRLLPFRVIAPWLGQLHPPHAVLPESIGTGETQQAMAVKAALRAAMRRLPWTSTCLMQSLAGRLMLGRRGVPSLVRLGVARGNAPERAHAWLIASGIDVSGGESAADFTPISDFMGGVRPPLR
ncbi:MAG: lasso peptide biosynthesis B2 protein [Elstera sp.]